MVRSALVAAGLTSQPPPVVPQPGITAHLAGAPEGADLAGVNPQVGNYATAGTDAKVATGAAKM